MNPFSQVLSVFLIATLVHAPSFAFVDEARAFEAQRSGIIGRILSTGDSDRAEREVLWSNEIQRLSTLPAGQRETELQDIAAALADVQSLLARQNRHFETAEAEQNGRIFMVNMSATLSALLLVSTYVGLRTSSQNVHRLSMARSIVGVLSGLGALMAGGYAISQHGTVTMTRAELAIWEHEIDVMSRPVELDAGFFEMAKRYLAELDR